MVPMLSTQHSNLNTDLVRHFVIVQADMMPQFMNDRVVHFLHHFFRALTQSEDRPAIDGNSRGLFPSCPEKRISRQRLALIETEQVAFVLQFQVLQYFQGWFLFHHDRDGFHQLGVGRRQIVDRLLDQLSKALN